MNIYYKNNSFQIFYVYKYNKQGFLIDEDFRNNKERKFFEIYKFFLKEISCKYKILNFIIII